VFTLTKDILINRLENICEFFDKHQGKYKQFLKKNPVRSYNPNTNFTYGLTKLDPSKILNAIKIDYNEEGNVKYPIMVTGSLKILNLGVVEHERLSFHSARNIFPIGYKSIREQQSMFFPNKRCEYMCEILDGGDGPVYRVTPLDDPENPITRDASSAVWVEICTRINTLNGITRAKVAVSGPDRFGLSEVAVT